MRRFILIAGILTAGLMAADYTAMTTEELVSLRGTVATEDREAFQTELQSRLEEMTPEERQALMSKAKAGAGTGTAAQTQTRTRSRAMDALNGDIGTGTGAMGRGAGGMGGGGHGSGNGGGHGGGHGGGMK